MRPPGAVQAAYVGAAGDAVAQMRPERNQRVGVGLTLGQRHQERRDAFTLLAALDPAERLAEVGPPFGDAAVDLGVRPVEPCADLGVGESLGLE
jgi:hypothetical protein